MDLFSLQAVLDGIEPWCVCTGDCVDLMLALPDDSVDAVVCDPPYGLEFMGKDWDRLGAPDGFRRKGNPNDANRENVFGRTTRTGPEYAAGSQMQEWHYRWAVEALRVLKPGGHLIAFGGCYDEATEVLTRCGWIGIADAHLTDEFASLNLSTSKVEFMRPVEIVRQRHYGEMHHYKTNRVDLLVTPNHKMCVSSLTGRRRFSLIESARCPRSVRMKKSSAGRVDATDAPFVLPATTRSVGRGHAHPVAVKAIPQEVWAAFFGLWLAEGSASITRVRGGKGYNVSIAHFNTSNLEELALILAPYFRVRVYPKIGKARINDVQLTEYLQQFGHAGDKFIPEEVKRFSLTALRVLLDWYGRGDGDGRRFYTGSDRLRDDVQEVALYAGWAVDWTTRTPRAGGIIKGRPIQSRLSQHVLSLLTRQVAPEVYRRPGKQNVRRVIPAEEWGGRPVFCVELPKNHTLYVRWNGKAVWCGNTRTYHRLACAVEDAGFEIRDQLQWLYGSGFPKSLDVSKAIDKAAGITEWKETRPNPAWRAGNSPDATTSTGWAKPQRPPKPIVETDAAKQWDGWGTALKPAHEPLVLARKPLSEPTVAANVLKWGTGALNVDECRIALDDKAKAMLGKAKQRTNKPSGKGLHHNPGGDIKRITLAKAIDTFKTGGRWPANVLLSHSPECVQVGTAKVKAPVINRFTDGAKPFGGGAGHPYETVQTSEDGLEEIEVWACVPGCPVRMLDGQSGQSRSTKGKPRKGQKGAGWGMEHTGTEHADAGGASRFFYIAKANRSEREAGLEGFPLGVADTQHKRPRSELDDPRRAGVTPRTNHHPTVKPIALMRYLVRLVTPPGVSSSIRLWARVRPASPRRSNLVGSSDWSRIPGMSQSPEPGSSIG